MKARTKHQKKIIGYSKAMPKLSPAQKADAFTLHKKYIRVTYKNFNYCLHCGHEWKENNFSVKVLKVGECPKCKEHLHWIDAPKNTPFDYKGWWEDDKVYGIIDTYKGYQVERLFMSTLDMAKGRKHKHKLRELAQHWIDQNGKVSSIYVGNSGCMYNIKWGHGEMQFRGGSSVGFKYGEEPHKYWKVKRFIPMLRRNGIKTSIHNIGAHRLFKALLTEPKIETLFKAKFYSLVSAYIYGSIDVGFHWDSIKIALRNNFKLKAKEWSEWSDLLDFLTYCGKDIRNAKYVCPENLTEAHDYWLHRQNMIMDGEAELERKRKAEYKALSDEEKTIIYQAEKGDLLNLIFTEGDITIEPLKTVQEFFKAGKKLHHCVGTYYQKKDKLILSAKCKKKLMETIEVSLKDFTVLQSRGLQNVETKHNAKIVELVNQNMNQIRRIA